MLYRVLELVELAYIKRLLCLWGHIWGICSLIYKLFASLQSLSLIYLLSLHVHFL